MAEASLEGIPTSISPIAVTPRSGSVTPLADAMELWENANKALKGPAAPQVESNLGTRYGTLSE